MGHDPAARCARGCAEALPFVGEFAPLQQRGPYRCATRPRSWSRCTALTGAVRARWAGKRAAIREALVEALGRRGIDGRPLDLLFLPTAEEYRVLLEAHGFAVRTIALFARPTPLPGDLSAWLETFAQSFLRAVSTEERPRLIDEVSTALRPRLYEAGRGWVADYVRLRFAAVKE